MARGEKIGNISFFSLFISEGIPPPLGPSFSHTLVNNRNRNVSFIYSICGASVLSKAFS